MKKTVKIQGANKQFETFFKTTKWAKA